MKDSGFRLYKRRIKGRELLGTMLLVYQTNSKPIGGLDSRISSGSCTFPNENGTCQITLNNLQYDDEDVYIAEILYGPPVAELKVTLNVKGEIFFLSFFFFFVFVKKSKLESLQTFFANTK